MARPLPVVVLVAALGTVSCGVDPVAPLELGLDGSPIINGQLDTSHQAVVLVYGSGTACSGTIVHVSGTAAYVLTAAHCGDPEYVLQGNDYDDPDRYYPVSDYARHPGWSGQPPLYDFMMVQASGASASTPSIPLLSPAEDSLAKGTQVRHVGYGLAGPPPGQETSERHQIVGTLSGVQALTVTYDQPNGGPCSGDSGGPQLTLGTERVAAVTSSGDKECKVSGTSGRVSAAYDSFIVPFINDTPAAPPTCDQCTQAALTGQSAPCAGAIAACESQSACAALMQCLAGCAQGDQACVNACAKNNSQGVGTYLKIFDCVCDSACVSECANDSLCDTGSTPPPPPPPGGDGGAGGDAAGGGGDPGAGGTPPDPTGPPPAGDGSWVAGNAANQEYEGDLLMSQCSAARGPDGGRAGGWLPLALGALGCARRRSRAPHDGRDFRGRAGISY